MSSIALPVGVPQGVNIDTAISYQVTADSTGISGYVFVVPTGKCWLMQTFSGYWFWNVARPVGQVYLQITDINGDLVNAGAAAGVTNVAANRTLLSTFTLGGSTAIFDNPSESMPVGSLPWVLTMPGSQYQFLKRPSGGADTTTPPALAWVTEFIFGDASDQPGATPIGPYLYVPGPEPVAA